MEDGEEGHVLGEGGLNEIVGMLQGGEGEDGDEDGDVRALVQFLEIHTSPQTENNSLFLACFSSLCNNLCNYTCCIQSCCYLYLSFWS